MALTEMVMPKMGESIIEATILKWLKKPGDSIKKDESVLEVATDKVDTEVPSTIAGTLSQILFKEGDVVAIGKAIALIETETSVETPVQTIAPVVPVVEANKTVVEKPLVATSSNKFYSPLVMNIAKQEHISVTELDTISGTGREG